MPVGGGTGGGGVDAGQDVGALSGADDKEVGEVGPGGGVSDALVPLDGGVAKLGHLAQDRDPSTTAPHFGQGVEDGQDVLREALKASLMTVAPSVRVVTAMRPPVAIRASDRAAATVAAGLTQEHLGERPGEPAMWERLYQLWIAHADQMRRELGRTPVENMLREAHRMLPKVREGGPSC